MKILLISSHGNPINPRLWSGTPANLMRSLSESDVFQVETFFTLKYKFVDSLLLAIEIFFSLRRRRSTLRRYITTKFLWLRLHHKAKGFSHLLFFDIEGDPKVLRNSHNKFKIYRLLDSTEIQWELVNFQSHEGKSSKIERMRDEESKILSAFDGFFVLTQVTKDSLIDGYSIESHKIRVVRTGLGQPISKGVKSKENGDSNCRNMLTIAKGEHWRKGIDLLLDVFRLNLLDEKYRLNAILGENFPHSVPAGVQKFGYLDLAELNDKYQMADIFILPCRFEPYGLVFIEAVRMGIPIVTTKHSGLGCEFINAGWPGSIVESDPASIAQGIIALESRETITLEDLGRLQREILGSFSWSKMAHDILQEWKMIRQ